MKKSKNITVLEEEAASQWGMFTSARAVASGVSRTQLSRMTADGRIESMSHGVYRFMASAETAHADIKAAWLSVCPKEPAWDRLRSSSPDAVVAARTAAYLYGVEFHPEPFAFAVGPGMRTARDDVRYLPWAVEGEDIVSVDGLPTTSVERTIADLIRLREDPSLVNGFVHEAAASHDLDCDRLATLLAPLASRNGYGKGNGEAFAFDLMASNVMVDKTLGSIYQLAKIADIVNKFSNGLSPLSEASQRAFATSMSQALANVDLSDIAKSINESQIVMKSADLQEAIRGMSCAIEKARAAMSGESNNGPSSL